MASFSDTPLEVIEKIIDALQDDLAAVKACSQTCLALLPLCRKYIFHTIELIPRSLSTEAKVLPRLITLFGRLMDNNPGIADYVQNLVYYAASSDFENDDVPRTLERLHRVQSFHFTGGRADWNAKLSPPFQRCLTKAIQSDSLRCLEISSIKNFPISMFIPCTNLVDLSLSHLEVGVKQSHEKEYSSPEPVARLQSFTFGVLSGEYVKRLVDARRSNNLPVLDFSELRTLGVNVDEHSDLAAVHALIRITEKLETLEYTVDYLTDGFTGLSAAMNPLSLSTLTSLHFEFDINDDVQDPLCGLCEELDAFTRINVIKEIDLQANVQLNCRCKTGDEWGRLDAALADGFPMLRKVSLSIIIWVFSSYGSGAILQEELNKLPEKQFPWLSNNDMVRFHFSAPVNLV